VARVICATRGRGVF